MPTGDPVASRPVPRGARRADRRRRAVRRRRTTLATVVLLVAVVVAVVVARGAGGGHRPPAAAPVSRPATTTSTDATTTTSAVPPTTTTSDAGALPQTGALPTTDASFGQRMAALWRGVTTGDVEDALPAFFPESAYVQLKDVPSPGDDYTGRLVSEYEEDLAAAHQLLGAGAATATLVGVDVDESYAHWVPPGVCDNTVGYYEDPNARVVYSEGGQTGSFGIASLISWRGEWYVVHLGAVLRDGAGGQVDDPEVGPGTPAYSGTC